MEKLTGVCSPQGLTCYTIPFSIQRWYFLLSQTIQICPGLAATLTEMEARLCSGFNASSQCGSHIFQIHQRSREMMVSSTRNHKNWKWWFASEVLLNWSEVIFSLCRLQYFTSKVCYLSSINHLWIRAFLFKPLFKQDVIPHFDIYSSHLIWRQNITPVYW